MTSPDRSLKSLARGGGVVLLAAAVIATACQPGGTPAQPTEAPKAEAKPTDAAKPTAAAAASPSPSPAAAPKPAAPSPSPSPAAGPPGKDIVLPPGYVVTEFASGFSAPIAMSFDDDGHLFVLDSGFPSFQPGDRPKPIEVWRVESNGQKQRVYTNSANRPNDLKGVALGIAAIDDDEIFVNDGQGLNRVRGDGTAQLILKLPTEGDYNANHITIGPDGMLYWGQGSATNAGVVGPDNEELTGWLKANPNYSDIPCRDVRLGGKNYTSPNILTPDPNDTTETGPFLPFGQRASAGQVVGAKLPCTSSILRANPDGSGLELVAWGFRNPFGLAFVPDGSPIAGMLVVTNNGSDVRGSRPIENDADDLYVVATDSDTPGWYGWPDYLDELPASEPRYWAPAPGSPPNSEARPVDLLLQSPGRADALGAITHFEKGASADGLDFSTSNDFGFADDAFVALWGSLGFGRNPAQLPGFNVSRVHIETDSAGAVVGATNAVFAQNRVQGSASSTGQNGFEHPVDVKFSDDGRTMYVLDFGIVGQPGTGRIWAIRRGSAPPAPAVPQPGAPPAPTAPAPAASPSPTPR